MFSKDDYEKILYEITMNVSKSYNLEKLKRTSDEMLLRLLKEHFRRKAIWIKAIAGEDEVPRTLLLLISISQKIDDTIMMRVFDVEEKARSLSNDMSQPPWYRSMVRELYQWLVLWKEGKITDTLSNPYVPLLLFAQYGGSYHYENTAQTLEIENHGRLFYFINVRPWDRFLQDTPFITEIDGIELG